MEEGRFRRKVNSEDGIRLVFAVDSNVAIDSHLDEESAIAAFSEVYEDFISYKQQSADFGNIPVPPTSVQMEYATIVDLFGKDKPNHFPKPAAKTEQVHHVHVFDGETDDELDAWIGKQQSRRSCDTLLFYSYFTFEDAHYFYVLKFVEDPDGHDFQADDKKMGDIVTQACLFRQAVLSGKQ